LLIADMRRWKNARNAAAAVRGDGPNAPNESPGPNPRTPDDGTTPRLAA
jgi:hypothetical protein